MCLLPAREAPPAADSVTRVAAPGCPRRSTSPNVLLTSWGVAKLADVVGGPGWWAAHRGVGRPALRAPGPMHSAMRAGWCPDVSPAHRRVPPARRPTALQGFSKQKLHTYLSDVVAIGTFAWVAPEVLLGTPCTLKVDVYSFGGAAGPAGRPTANV